MMTSIKDHLQRVVKLQHLRQLLDDRKRFQSMKKLLRLSGCRSVHHHHRTRLKENFNRNSMESILLPHPHMIPTIHHDLLVGLVSLREVASLPRTHVYRDH